MTGEAAAPAADAGRDLRVSEQAVGRWRVRLTSYRLDDRWVCVADNVDPGANVARAHGTSREEAEAAALARASERLGATRAIPV
jgi:hypothetical protein